MALHHIWDSDINIITNPTQVELSREQYPILSCANRIRAIRGSVCSFAIFGGGVHSCLVEVYIVVCCLCSTEYGPCTVCRSILLSAFLGSFRYN